MLTSSENLLERILRNKDIVKLLNRELTKKHLSAFYKNDVDILSVLDLDRLIKVMKEEESGEEESEEEEEEEEGGEEESEEEEEEEEGGEEEEEGSLEEE